MQYLFVAIALLLADFSFSQVIYFTDFQNDNWDLYSLSLKDGSIKSITTDTQRDFQSDYSPVQNKLVFDSYRDENHRNIFTLDMDSGQIDQLTKLDSRDGHPVWSPDGQRIAFQSGRTGNSEVFIMDQNGEEVEQLTFDDRFDGIPKWSPDGRFLAFNSSRDGSPNVFILDLESKKSLQITSDAHTNFVQDWLSGDELLVISDKGGKKQLYKLDIKNKRMVHLPSSVPVTHARCNAEGEIVFSGETSDGGVNIFMIKSDGSGWKQLTFSKTDKRFPSFGK